MTMTRQYLIMFRTLILILLSANSALCANILFVSPIPSPSHHIWNRALAHGLAAKGHNVTLIGPDKDKTNPANYTHIYMEGAYDGMETYEINDFSSYGPFRMLFEIIGFGEMLCDTLLQSNGTKTLLNYPEDFFDLILFDVTGFPFSLGFIHKFKYPPTVGVTAYLLPTYVAHTYGNPLFPSYVAWHSSGYTSDMSFVERFWNWIITYAELLVKRFKEYPFQHKMASQVFGDDLPKLKNLERHISLILTNTDPVLDSPKPLAPNFIPVGGLHTRKGQKLTQDLQTVLDNAKDGAIIFSLGTNVRSDKLNKEVQKSLIDAFSKLKQAVIWKFESDFENLPKNVIIKKWLPQNDLLGHPNVKLFIGHGGALSTQEAAYHGVPVVCIPFFADQHLNAKNIVNRKLGVTVDLLKITEKYILEKIQEVLDNPIYAENAHKLSERFKDRTETPLERAIFWTEYTLRHGGAQFLSTPERDLPFYVSTSLDVVAVSALISFLVVYVVTKIVQLFWNLSKSKRKQKIN